MTTLFRAGAPSIILFAGDPRAIAVVLLGPDGEPQDLTGRALQLSIRRSVMLEPITLAEGMISADGLSYLFLLTAEQCQEIYEVGQNYALSYDVVETTFGGSNLRWTGRIEPKPGSALPSDSAPVVIDLPASQLVAAADTIAISELGAMGPGVEKRFADKGLIPAPDTDLMIDKIKEWGEAGAAPSAEAAQQAAQFAEQQALATQDLKDASEAARDVSLDAAERADAAALSATAQGPLWLDKDEGLAATAEGEQFRYYNGTTKLVEVYTKTGGVAVYLGVDLPTSGYILDRTRALNYNPVTVDGDVAVIADPVSGRMPWWIDPLGRLFAEALDRGGNPYLTRYSRPTVDGDAASFYDPVSGRMPWWLDGHGRLHADHRNLDGAELTPMDLFTAAVAGLRYDGQTVDGDAALIMGPDQRLPLWVDGRGNLRGGVMDAAGNPYLTALSIPYGKRSLYAPDRMRQAASRLRSIKIGVSSTPIVFAMIGDSWTGSSLYWIRAFVEQMQAEYGDGGPGWTAFAFSSSGSIAGCARADVTATKSGAWTSNYFTGGSADAGQVTSSTPGDKYTITLAGPAIVTHVILHASSGTLRYRWNGGTWTEIAISGDALQTFSLAGVPATAWTLEIEVVSGTVKMSGLDLQKSGGGVRVHKLGKNGSNTAHWTSVPEADFITGMAALAPHVVQIMHLTNDQILSGQAPVSPSQHAANVTELIRRARIAAPVADMLLVSPPSVRSQGSPQTAYAIADRGVAIAQACTHLDLQYAFGERYEDYAYGSARALLDDTLIHPTQTFGRATILDALIRTLTTAQ